jgi:hypothetical protein
MSEQQSIPIIGTIRGARQLPISVVTRCIALQTFSGGLSNDTQQQALLDMFCLLPACMFDAERGGFVCDEHGGALCDHTTFRESLDCNCQLLRLEKVERANPFRHEHRDLPQPQRALKAIEQMELVMRAQFISAYSNATVADFEAIKPKLWEEIGRSLTQQVRISTACVLGRVEN